MPPAPAMRASDARNRDHVQTHVSVGDHSACADPTIAPLTTRLRAAGAPTALSAPSRSPLIPPCPGSALP
jgi:hypothetical protein